MLAGVVHGEEPVRPGEVDLSADERAWVAAHPTVTIALDDANPPLNFRRPDGTYAGLSVDYLELITAKAGLRLELVGATWNVALSRAMQHEVDGLMSASFRSERLSALSFTKPYCEMPEALVTRDDFPLVDSLAGFAKQRVAVVAGTVRSALLRQQAVGIDVVEVANAGEGLRALAEGRVAAFFDDLPVIQEQIDRLMVGHVRVALLYFQPEAGAQRIALRNDAPLLRTILDKAIGAISPAEHRTLRDRWLHAAAGAAVQHDLGLDAEERAWLATHPVLHAGCNPEVAPIEWRDGNGAWRGISVDYLERLHQLLGVTFVIDPVENWPDAQRKLGDGDIDLLVSLAETPERRERFSFTPPYAASPVAIFARSDVGYLHGLEALVGQPVAVARGYVEEMLRSEHPGISLVVVSTAREGLDQLRHGSAVAYVGALLPTAFRLQAAGDLSIHVVGETPYSFRQAMAVRKDRPELQAILGKALAAIPQDERDAMWRHWVALNYQQGTDFSLLWKLGLPLLAVLAAFLYWNRRLSAEVRSRISAERELIAYRDRLAELVRERTADLEAAMGRLRRLAAAIEQTAEGVVLAAPDGHVVFVNPAFSRITGVSAELALSQGLGQLGLPWGEAAVQRGEWRGRLAGHRPDGVAYELEAVVSAVSDGAGRLIDLLVVLRDVTGARLIAERLAQSQKLEAVGTLAGGIAHDFNNILAAILGAAQLAEKADQPPERRQAHIKRIVVASERARMLVRQMLTFSRATPGERRPVEVAPIIAEALDLLRASLPTTIELRPRLAAGVTVLGDATRLHQVVMNLCTNAGLAMPQGGVLEVVLERWEVDAPFAAAHQGLACGPAARLVVRDSGVGMDRATLARVFEPFFTTRPQGQGTGLGLAVVHGVVHESGGAITVASEPGQGTTFTIVLPLVAAPVAEAPRATGWARGSGERILLVDDEVALREITAELLTELDYRVTTARDGQEALELLTRDPAAFELLITDSTMPRLTGAALIAAAARIAPKLPVILCSGNADAAPGVRFLAKPVPMAALATAIRETLRG